MSAPGYHGWTHRPKELGGVDPLSIVDPPYHIKVFADDESCSTGDGKFQFHIPLWYDGFYLIYVEAFVTTAGANTVQIRNVTDSHDLLSTALTIDAGEECSADAAVPAVINQSYNQVSHKDKIAIDVDVAGGMGLEVVLLFEPWQIVP